MLTKADVALAASAAPQPLITATAGLSGEAAE